MVDMIKKIDKWLDNHFLLKFILMVLGGTVLMFSWLILAIAFC